MAPKKKRGASSGTDSSSRGGKKRVIVTGGSGGGGSSGKDRARGDKETRKMDKALENAYKLSDACKQHRLSDVKTVTWKLKTNENGVIENTYADFKDVLDARRKLFKNVMPLLIHGVPVTQPKSNEIYHIIDIEVDGDLVLQLLFRQSDGYLVAFRRVSTKGNPVWEGWYYFKDKDIILPSFCVQTLKLKNLESGYTNGFLEIRFGKGIVSDIIKCLSAFTPENCDLKSYGEHNRVVLIQTLMVFFDECQRSGVFLEFAEKHYESETLVPVNTDLSKHRNSWSNLSTALLALFLGFLLQEHGVHGWEAILQSGKDQMTREVREFTNLGLNGIERFIEYHDELDADGKKVPKFMPSMQNLLGSDIQHLLHLIKYDEESVLEIHLAMMKLQMVWPVQEAEPDQ